MLRKTIVFIFIVGCYRTLGIPAGPDSPAAVAAGPAPSTDAASPATGEQPPTAVAAPPPKANNNVAAPPSEGSGNGIVTEHKNPDGSTITVTRFNGPLPNGAFPSGLAGLHDAYLQRNLYQTQLIQLQAQQSLNDILYRSFYPPYPVYNSYFTYPFIRTPPGNFISPFVPYGFGYNPFFHYPSQSQRVARSTEEQST